MKVITTSLIPWIILFSIFMVLIGYGITILPAMQRRFFLLPKIIQKTYVILFMAPVIILPLIPQTRYSDYKSAGVVAGIFISTAAISIWGLSLFQMKGVPSVRKAAGLVTNGIYSQVRNPIYTANFIILPGLGLMTSSVVALMYTPVWFVLLAVLCVLEESGLKRQYGCEYHEYMKKVPYRLIRFVF